MSEYMVESNMSIVHDPEESDCIDASSVCKCSSGIPDWVTLIAG